MLTELERAALNLLVELELSISQQRVVPFKVILAMNELKRAATTPRFAEAETILRFARIAEEENKKSQNKTILTLKQPLYLVTDDSN